MKPAPATATKLNPYQGTGTREMPVDRTVDKEEEHEKKTNDSSKNQHLWESTVV